MYILLYDIVYQNYSFFLELRGLLGRGVLSTLSSLKLSFLLPQLPRTGSRAAEPCTLSETVLSQNCFTVGLSLLPPRALCLPKKDSAGSWHNFSERRYVTPGSPNSTGVISMKELTIWDENNCSLCAHVQFQ